jgi:predicted RNA methylase
MFFDIGANIGKWSVANIKRCDKIVTIEASPITFEIIYLI